MLLELSTDMESEQRKILEKFKEIFQQIDKGLLLGAPLPSSPKLLTEIASSLNSNYAGKIFKLPKNR